ncbi:MAG TPA: amidohydrolase [Actinobacteria bacterium]|nr:amidohydrolase [Actinomycetota bacterium]
MNCTPQHLRSVVEEVIHLAVETRHHIHQYPEIGHQEFATTQYIAGILADAGLEPRVRPARTGLVVDVGAGGPIVAFRADIDALPIQEKTGLPFESQNPGLMHACGHDVHSAIAVGIAVGLSKLEALDGTARFIFQPAEEQFPGGAQDLIDEGRLDGTDSIIAFHVDPALLAGKIGFRAGPITASSDQFHITVEGPGGHTARPHLTADTVYTAGRIITELPPLLDRLIDSRVPLVVVFGSIHGGTADNVIPSKIELRGTARTLGREVWERMPKLVDQLVHEIASPTGATVTVRYATGIAPVINDEHTISEARFAVGQILGPHSVVATQPSMGAEDFSAYLEDIPGAMFRLGAASEGRDPVDLHSSRFDVDERAIETGVLAGAATLMGMLSCNWVGE